MHRPLQAQARLEKGGGQELPTLVKELLAFDCCQDGKSGKSPLSSTDLADQPHPMWAPHTAVVSQHKLDLMGKGRSWPGS